jgi:hypothetical protein
MCVLRLKEQKEIYNNYQYSLRVSKIRAEAEQAQRKLNSRIQENVNKSLSEIAELHQNNKPHRDEEENLKHPLILQPPGKTGASGDSPRFETSTTGGKKQNNATHQINEGILDGESITSALETLINITVSPSQLTTISLEDVTNYAISVNMDDAIKHKITFKCKFRNNLNIFADELRLTLILSGIVNNMISTAEEESAIEIRTIQDKSHVIFIFREPHGYPRNIDSKDVEDNKEHFNRSKPNWTTTKALTDSEGYSISSTHSDDTGFILFLKIPHIEDKNVLFFK